MRDAALAGALPCGAAARRFWRAGLPGLVVRPAALPVFVAEVVATARPPWTPYGDPRAQALADGYELLLCAGEAVASVGAGAQ